MNLSYDAYLRTSEWAALRKIKLQQNGYRCQGCSGDERLEVHHLSYKRLGYERLEELMVLCHLCHAKEHGRTPDRTGPIAGPTSAELQARVRERDLEREQTVKMLRKLRYRQVLARIRTRQSDSATMRRAKRRDERDRSSPFRYV